ncbi:MAG: DUF47 domain-containing protein [Rhizobium sp.]|nr:DUF47 domain-containing protein [Rhizobium sp.]
MTKIPARQLMAYPHPPRRAGMEAQPTYRGRRIINPSTANGTEIPFLRSTIRGAYARLSNALGEICSKQHEAPLTRHSKNGINYLHFRISGLFIPFYPTRREREASAGSASTVGFRQEKVEPDTI